MPASEVTVNNPFALMYASLSGSGALAPLWEKVGQAWFSVVVGGYVISFIALGVIVYTIIKLHELRAREKAELGTLIIAPETTGGMNPRWKHIQTLAGGSSQSEWREAIIEADIMLGDMLSRQGYGGVGVAEKLQAVERSDFSTLDNAWEAHKVRNQIAHEGSAFDLSETLARRTIAQFESVFREFNAI